MTNPKINSPWVFLGLYGESETGKHHITWNLIKALKPNENTPWIIMSDFNEVLFSSEKFSGRTRSEKPMQELREALANYNLIDLGHNGIFSPGQTNTMMTLSRRSDLTGQ